MTVLGVSRPIDLDVRPTHPRARIVDRLAGAVGQADAEVIVRAIEFLILDGLCYSVEAPVSPPEWYSVERRRCGSQDTWERTTGVSPR